MSSLHFITPLVLPKRSPILGWLPFAVLPVRADQFNSTLLLQSLSERIAVSSLVIQQMLRDFSWNLQVVQEWFDQLHFASVGCGEVGPQGSSFRINDVDHLAAFTTLGLSNLVPPFFARTNQASAAASF